MFDNIEKLNKLSKIKDIFIGFGNLSEQLQDITGSEKIFKNLAQGVNTFATSLKTSITEGKKLSDVLAKNLGGSAQAASAMMTAATVGISLAIGAAVYAYTSLKQAEEERRQATEELISTYKNSTSTIESNIKTLQSLEDEYTKLSKGVNEHGSNVSLTADEYSRYKEIIQQIININPGMKDKLENENLTWQEQNDLIKDNIELQNEAKKRANDKLISGAKDIFDTTTNETKSILKNLELAKKIVDNIGNGKISIHDLQIDYGDVNKFKDIVKDIGVDISNNNWWDISGDSRKIIDFDISEDQMDMLESKISSYTQQLEDKYGNLQLTLTASLENNDVFANLDKSLQNIIINNKKAMNPGDYNNYFEMLNELSTFTNQLNGLDEKQKELISNFYFIQNSGIESFGNLANAWSELKALIPSELLVKLGFEYNSRNPQIQNFLNDVGDSELLKHGGGELEQEAITKLKKSLDELNPQQLELVSKYFNEADIAGKDAVLTLVETGEAASEIDPTRLEKLLKVLLGIQDSDTTETTSNTDKLKTAIDAWSSSQSEAEKTYTKSKIDEILKSWLSDIEKIADAELRSDAFKEYESAAKQAEGATKSFKDMMDELNKQLDSIQSSYNSVSRAIDEFNENGYISVDTYQSLLDIAPEYIGMLLDEEGNLTLTKEALYAVAEARIDDLAAKQKTEMLNLVSTYENEEAALNALKSKIDETTKSQIDLNAELLKGIEDERLYNELLNRFNATDKWAESAKAGIGKDGLGSNNNSTKKNDSHKEEAEKQIKEIQYLRDMDKISEEQYFYELDKINVKFYKDKSKYLDDYRKYEKEVYNGMQKVQEDNLKAQADAFKASIQDLEHELFGAEQSDNYDDQIVLYKQIQEELHKEAERYRALGLSETADEIQELQVMWANYSDKIKDTYESKAKSITDNFTLITDEIEKSLSDKKFEYDTVDKDGYTSSQKNLNEQIEIATNLNNTYIDQLNELKNNTDPNITSTEEYKNAVVELEGKVQNVTKSLYDLNDQMKSNEESFIKLAIDLMNDDIKKIEDAKKASKDAHDARIKEIDAEIALVKRKHSEEDKLAKQQEAIDNEAERVAQQAEDDLKHQADQQKKLLEIEKLRIELANTKKEKNIRQLTTNDDGTIDFAYVADQTKIDNLEEQITTKEQDYVDSEVSYAKKRAKELIATEKQKNKELQALERESEIERIESQKSYLQSKYEIEQDSFDKDIDALKANIADIEKKLLNNKQWQISNLKDLKNELEKTNSLMYSDQLKALSVFVDKHNAEVARMHSISATASNTSATTEGSTSVDGSHKSGLPYVPFDSYIAELHKGERVLTAEENKEYAQNTKPDSKIKPMNESDVVITPDGRRLIPFDKVDINSVDPNSEVAKIIMSSQKLHSNPLLANLPNSAIQKQLTNQLDMSRNITTNNSQSSADTNFNIDKILMTQSPVTNGDSLKKSILGLSTLVKQEKRN